MSANNTHGLVLTAINLARASMRAAAASIALYDEGDDTLAFLSADGVGAESVIGKKVPARTGVAGLALQAGSAILIQDTAAVPEFNRAFAESTGYVPTVIAAAPMFVDDEVVGVVEVLDPALDSADELHVVLLTEAIAENLAITTSVLRRLERSERSTHDTRSMAMMEAGLWEISDAQFDMVRNLTRSLHDAQATR